MRAFKAFLATVLSICFLLATVVWIVSWGANRSVLRPDYYEAVLDRNNLYPKVLTTLKDSVSRQVLRQVPTALQKRVRDGLDLALTDSWLRGQVDALLTEGLGYLKGEVPTLALGLDVAAAKKSLQQALQTGQVPEGATLYEQGLRESLSRVPDRLKLTPPIEAEALSRVRQVARVVAWLPLAALATVVVAGWLLWLLGGARLVALRLPGALLLAAGILVTAVVMVAQVRALPALAAVDLSFLPSELTSGSNALLSSAAGLAVRGLLFLAGTTAAAGFALVLTSGRASRRLAA